MGTTPLRADAAANAGFDMDGHSRETLLLAIAVPWVYEHMQGRRRDASGVLLPPLPSSVLNVLRNVRRAHKRLGITMAPLTLAVQATERLIQRYRDEHGPEALQPRRKEPLTNAIVVALLTLPTGTVVGSTAVDYARLEWISLRAQYAVHAQTGMRKSETCIPNGRAFGKKHLSRANLAWKIGGVFVRDPSRVQLAALREGDFAVLIVAPSKADQHGLHWGQAPIYLPYHARDDICAARALAALELAWELHGAERRTSPLFVAGDDKRPVTLSQAERRFDEMLAAVHVPVERRRTFSMHSWRVYLACALLARGAPPTVIQSMLRWRSDEALRIYARLNDVEYATWLDVAATATISGTRAANLPPVVGTAAEAAAREQRDWLRAVVGADVEAVAPADRPVTDCDLIVGQLADGVRALTTAAANADAED